MVYISGRFSIQKKDFIKKSIKQKLTNYFNFCVENKKLLKNSYHFYKPQGELKFEIVVKFKKRNSVKHFSSFQVTITN